MKTNDEALYEATSTAILLAGGSFVSVLVAGLGSLVLARLLGPEGYGAYSLVLAVPAFLGAFVELGLPAALLRYASRYPDRATSYVTLGLLVTVAAASVLAVLGALLSEPLSRVLINRPGYSDLVAASMPFLIAYSVFNITRASLIGIGRRLEAVSLEPLYNLARIPLSLVLALLMGVRGAVLGFVSASIISASAGIAILFRRLGGFNVGLGSGELRELALFSAPLYLTTLTASLTNTYTTVVMSRFFTDFEIGNYRASLNLLTVISIAIAPLSTAFLRVFSRMSVEELEGLLPDSIKYVTLFSIPLTLFSALSSHDIVRVVYGRRYEDAASYFSILVLTYMLTSAGSHVLGPALGALGRTKYVLLANLVGSSLYVPLLYLLAGGLGLHGVAASYVALNATTTLVQLYLLGRCLEVRLDPRFSLKVVVSSLLPSALVSLIGRGYGFADSLLYLLVKFSLFVVMFVSLLVLSRAVVDRDIARLYRLVESLGPLSRLLHPILRYVSLLVRLLQG